MHFCGMRNFCGELIGAAKLVSGEYIANAADIFSNYAN